MLEFHSIIESLRLGKTFKMESHCNPAAMTLSLVPACRLGLVDL